MHRKATGPVRWLLPLVLLIVPLSGCLGGDARSEWAFEITRLDEAYDDGLRGEGVVVAVVDTGINVGHPSLSHLRNGKASDGELIAFRDFLAGRTGVDRAFDDDGHGTHVSGIISARGSDFGDKLVNGGVDLLGASPGVSLVVARVCDPDGCDANVIDNAVSWAVEQGADVISLSLGGVRLGLVGGILNDEQRGVQQDIESAINDAIDNGVVVVAAAGNDGRDASDVSFPGSISGVLSVGAIDDDGRVADFSNRGSGNSCSGGPLQQGRCHPNQKPELVAPGVGILSAWTGDAYVRADGTSQATPFVTAVVALMLEGQPRLADRDDVIEVKRILMQTARDVMGQESPHDDAAGYGIVQATTAIKAFQG